jgi:hypothetical protein
MLAFTHEVFMPYNSHFGAENAPKNPLSLV